ncbi:hypothetical protein HPP92_019170 [Vanilla planifolia]|uniref:Bromo domain-containing protein n=1 Tax=Vanilla planifolia TaxID=51239 RepID=A0A835Q2E4_VANPL|nr:hypothetical protein HPP92_019170 [Vanilla planifolia]
MEDEAFGAAGEDGSPAEVPWLEELRKLRMAELRREVERSDIFAIKAEEFESGAREKRCRKGDLDLKEQEKNMEGESPGSAPETLGRDRISGGESGRSCKESNSTDPKATEEQPGGEEATEPVQAPQPGGPTSISRPARELSYNGSSETLSKGEETPDAAPPPPGESGESVAGDAPEGEAEKESSDVQSSASLSRRWKGRRRKTVSGSSSVAEEAEADAVSPVTANAKRTGAESQPLASFFEIVRSSKYGSFFVRRLESQESARYRSLIRRHVDMEMVRTRLMRKGAKYSAAEFFRDLLLICNNAIVFYPNGSPELAAAVALREMVIKEMSTVLPKPEAIEAPAAKEPSSPLTKVVKRKIESEKKNVSSGTLMACGKRSSLSAKAAAALETEAVGKEERERNSDSDEKDMQTVDSKLKPKERLKVSGARGFRTSKSRAINSSARISKLASVSKTTPTADSIAEEVPQKVDKKTAPAASTSTLNKRNAAGFLNRLKGESGSSPGTGTLLNSLKSSGSKGVEQKRGVKGDGRKEVASSRSEKLVAETGTPAKRSVGRPPKRMAPTPSPPPAKKTKVEASTAKRPPPPQRKRGRK